jgi:hypothetical protein
MLPSIQIAIVLNVTAQDEEDAGLVESVCSMIYQACKSVFLYETANLKVNGFIRVAR